MLFILHPSYLDRDAHLLISFLKFEGADGSAARCSERSWSYFRSYWEGTWVRSTTCRGKEHNPGAGTLFFLLSKPKFVLYLQFQWDSHKFPTWSPWASPKSPMCHSSLYSMVTFCINFILSITTCVFQGSVEYMFVCHLWCILHVHGSFGLYFFLSVVLKLLIFIQKEFFLIHLKKKKKRSLDFVYLLTFMTLNCPLVFFHHFSMKVVFFIKNIFFMTLNLFLTDHVMWKNSNYLSQCNLWLVVLIWRSCTLKHASLWIRCAGKTAACLKEKKIFLHLVFWLQFSLSVKVLDSMIVQLLWLTCAMPYIVSFIHLSKSKY